MAKKRIVGVLVLFISVCILFGVTNMYKKSLNGIRYYYDEGDEYVLNPYIGYAPSADSITLCEKASLVYLNIFWSELEPEEGVFNWEKIEETHNLQRWRAEGKHLVLRFVCDNPGTGEHMDIPSWLYEKTGDGEMYDIEYGKGYCPDYNNETFIEAHGKAVKEIADHFRDDDFLAYVELGSLGHWGEWHTYYFAGLPKMPLTDVREKYVEHYVKNFDYCKLLMRRTFAELPEGAGVFNDMAGISHDTSIWLRWIEEGGLYSETGEENGLKAVPNIWEKAPVGGEFSSSVPISTMLGKDFDQTAELLQKSHMSFLGPMVPYIKRENLEFYESADKMARNLGYRYRVKELEIKKPFGSSEATATIKMTNDGVAPVYFDYTPCLYLSIPENPDSYSDVLNNDGFGAAGSDFEGMYRFEMDIDLKSLFQNEIAEYNLKLPKELLKLKGVEIYAGIENSASGLPEIMLDMEGDRKGKLSLLWVKE